MCRQHLTTRYAQQVHGKSVRCSSTEVMIVSSSSIVKRGLAGENPAYRSVFALLRYEVEGQRLRHALP